AQRRPQLVAAQPEPRAEQRLRPREAERVPGEPNRGDQELEPFAAVVGDPRRALEAPDKSRVERAQCLDRLTGRPCTHGGCDPNRAHRRQASNMMTLRMPSWRSISSN